MVQTQVSSRVLAEDLVPIAFWPSTGSWSMTLTRSHSMLDQCCVEFTVIWCYLLQKLIKCRLYVWKMSWWVRLSHQTYCNLIVLEFNLNKWWKLPGYSGLLHYSSHQLFPKSSHVTGDTAGDKLSYNLFRPSGEFVCSSSKQTYRVNI